MEEQDSEDGIEFLGRYGTIEVLEYMKDHPQCEKVDLTNLVEDITVAELIEKLQKTGLVDEDVALTEKGKTLLVYLGCLREMLMGESNSSESCIDWCPLPKKVNRERHKKTQG
jgi:hypothetical protein